ncbi:beta-ketoacyl-ACP synthase III [Ligilactobacillus sp. Marseille-Q7487]|uniref:beta-ketoacyl-ACP synthase III n=1 Tax=Ligilactobacillus sp. Marseille-Q7487 TaxID=3022128 RepID=UPI0024A93ED0|nr:beta-ketoacyl-ACP synthase III [Ligilactobacillus sp. Marseille-Q7487]
MAKIIKIKASAGYLPSRVVTNEELAELMPTSDEWIQKHTGIKTRHYALNEQTSQMASKVAQELLKQAKVNASEIDLIIVATISGDAITPATAALVQEQIQAQNAFAFDISAACAGFIFALSTAEKFLRGVYHKALVICAESNSKMLDFTDRTSAVFFGDGAAGVLLESCQGDLKKDCFKAEMLCTKGNADVIHSGKIAPLSEVVATNYPQTTAFYQDGRSVYEFVTTQVSQHMKDFLAQNNLTAQQIDLFIVHQANLRLIEQLAKQLNVSLDKFVINVTHAGNTSSVGIPLALSQAWQAQKRPAKVMLTGFGAGLAYGSLLLDLSNN